MYFDFGILFFNLNMHIFACVSKMEFKKLEIQPEGSWVKRILLSQHGRKNLTVYRTGGSSRTNVLFFKQRKLHF